MRTWVLAGLVLGGLYLLGRKGRPDRGVFETELEQAVSAGWGVAREALSDAVAGGHRIWDEATTVTGAPALDNGRSTSVFQPRGSLLGVPEEYLRPVEPITR